jgi:alkylation response protein AidB-like acyl-CoA dehydrogenase
VVVGGFVGGDPAQRVLLLVAPGDYSVADTWFTAGMRATGSNTIVTDDAFVPESHVIRLADLIEGTAPGGEVHAGSIYRAPFAAYAPIAFVTPMLGAAQGVYEEFKAWAATRATPAGTAMAGSETVQAGTGSAGARLGAAELLVRHTCAAAGTAERPSLEVRARSLRDLSFAAELVVEAVDTLVAMSGTAGFASSSPLQRAWRDLHFAAAHISLKGELNYGHWGRTELGVERPASQYLF